VGAWLAPAEEGIRSAVSAAGVDGKWRLTSAPVGIQFGKSISGLCSFAMDNNKRQRTDDVG
jgi:hypothetical protein